MVTHREEKEEGPFPSLGDLPDPGIQPGFPSLQAHRSPSEPPGKPRHREEKRGQIGAED